MSGVSSSVPGAPELAHSSILRPKKLNGRSAGKARRMTTKEWGRDLVLLVAVALERSTASPQRMGERTPLVSHAIIAGWGVVVSASRLKWKIAARIFGRHVCCVTCLPMPSPPPPTTFLSTSLGVWKASWHWDACFQPKPLGSFLHRFKCAAGVNIGSGWLFYPTAQVCPQR